MVGEKRGLIITTVKTIMTDYALTTGALPDLTFKKTKEAGFLKDPASLYYFDLVEGNIVCVRVINVI